MHTLGVYHHDLIASNCIWNGKSITIIDFENATFRANAEVLNVEDAGRVTHVDL